MQFNAGTASDTIRHFVGWMLKAIGPGRIEAVGLPIRIGEMLSDDCLECLCESNLRRNQSQQLTCVINLIHTVECERTAHDIFAFAIFTDETYEFHLSR